MPKRGRGPHTVIDVDTDEVDVEDSAKASVEGRAAQLTRTGERERASLTTTTTNANISHPSPPPSARGTDPFSSVSAHESSVSAVPSVSQTSREPAMAERRDPVLEAELDRLGLDEDFKSSIRALSPNTRREILNDVVRNQQVAVAEQHGFHFFPLGGSIGSLPSLVSNPATMNEALRGRSGRGVDSTRSAQAAAGGARLSPGAFIVVPAPQQQAFETSPYPFAASRHEQDDPLYPWALGRDSGSHAATQSRPAPQQQHSHSRRREEDRGSETHNVGRPHHHREQQQQSHAGNVDFTHSHSGGYDYDDNGQYAYGMDMLSGSVTGPTRTGAVSSGATVGGTGRGQTRDEAGGRRGVTAATGGGGGGGGAYERMPQLLPGEIEVVDSPYSSEEEETSSGDSSGEEEEETDSEDSYQQLQRQQGGEAEGGRQRRFRSNDAGSDDEPLAQMFGAAREPRNAGGGRGAARHPFGVSADRDRPVHLFVTPEMLSRMLHRGGRNRATDGGEEDNPLAHLPVALQEAVEMLMGQVQQTMALHSMGIHGDVDDMTYEELLALEEQVGSVNRGLSSDEIAAVTTVLPAEPSEGRCPICLDEWPRDVQERPNPEPCVEVKGCGHVFHKACLDEWLTQSKTCPVCKKEVTENS